MCGLVGGIGLISDREFEALRLLYMVNVTRGPHSSGFFATYEEEEEEEIDKVKKKVWNKYYIHKKSLMPSSAYVFDSEFNNVLRKKPTIIACHSRYATKGKINLQNAHPFQVGKILGMHNGTINGLFEGSAKYQTDSEAVMALINKKGLKEGLDAVHREAFSVAYALVFYDNKTDCVSIIRNPDRPMYVAYHKKVEGRMFWSSDKLHLVFTLAKYEMKDDYEIEDVPPYTLVNLYAFNTPNKRIEILPDWYKPVERVYAKNSYVSNGPHNSLGYPYNTRGWYDDERWHEAHDTVKKNRDKIIEAKHRNGLPEDWETIKVGNKYFSCKEVDKQLEAGCMVCTQPSVILNRNLNMKFWRGTNDFLCSDCGKPDNMEYLQTQYGIHESELITPEFIESKRV